MSGRYQTENALCKRSWDKLDQSVHLQQAIWGELEEMSPSQPTNFLFRLHNATLLLARLPMWHLVAAAVAPDARWVAGLGRLDPQSLGSTTQRKAHHQLWWSSPGELDFPGFSDGLKPKGGFMDHWGSSKLSEFSYRKRLVTVPCLTSFSPVCMEMVKECRWGFVGSVFDLTMIPNKVDPFRMMRWP